MVVCGHRGVFPIVGRERARPPLLSNRRDPGSPLVFHRDGIPIRRWRTAWCTACHAAGVPTRFLHDCRRTAARNLIRANVPERVAMLLTGHHELGDVLSGHWSTSTSAGAAIVFLGDQSPVPTQDRIRGDDARDLRQDPPAEFVTAHSESTTLGVRQAKRPRAQVFSEDPILLPEIVDQIVLVTVHPASEREDEELQRRRHSLRLLGRLDQHRPSLGRFFAPYAVQVTIPSVVSISRAVAVL